MSEEQTEINFQIYVYYIFISNIKYHITVQSSHFKIKLHISDILLKVDYIANINTINY